MIKLAQVSKILNKYLFTDHVFGLNDCNIILADYLDHVLGTDYYNQLYGKYDSIQSGIKLAKSAGLNSPRHVLNKIAIKAEVPETGDILLTKTGKHFSVSIVFKNQAIAEHDNKYVMVPLETLKPDLIYRIEGN
jgi:hypothetical protein